MKDRGKRRIERTQENSRGRVQKEWRGKRGERNRKGRKVNERSDGRGGECEHWEGSRNLAPRLIDKVGANKKQESRAIAKMTARCALL